MDIPIPLQEALRDSITSGTFIDTKFWVFSKRSLKGGRVGEPKALFVNGHVVRSVPRLSALLGQKETKENLRAQFPADRKPYTGDYDYDADSDLEEADDCDFFDVEDSQVAPKKVKSDESDSGTGCIQTSDRKGNSSPDVISISDVDSLFSETPGTKSEAEMVATPTPAHIGTVVVIEDVAFVTFRALLRYLYTNKIEFAPWGSEERRKARALEETSKLHRTQKPSPKSVYRLADKYDIPELKELALQQIQRDLSKCDIVEEVFSRYTSRYPPLRKLELKQLARTLLSTESGPARRALKDMIKAYSRGQLPHAKDVLPALYELMETDEAFKVMPAQPPAASNQGVAGRDWKGLRDALTWSLTSGAFLDSQFYALDSKSWPDTPRIRPVYFCSTAGGAFLPKLLKYSSRLGPSAKTLLQSADDYDSDADDEASDMGIPVDAYPRSACIPEDPLSAYEPLGPAHVLKSGTAKTWRAIFFYVYTSRIAFSTIGSPEATTESRGKEISDSSSSIKASAPQNPEATGPSPSGVAAVGPCSPKSVYALADKIGLASLCDLAFDNIKSQLCEKNIVKELFSLFTANHERIMEMQHELFHSKFKPSVERSLLLDTIKDSPLGENPHRAAAMELIFERTIDDCQERMLAQAKKSSQVDPAVQPDSCRRAVVTSTFTAVPQPTTAQPPPPTTQSSSVAVQPVQIQPLRTEPVLPKIQPSQTPEVQPPQPFFTMPFAQPPPSRVTGSTFGFGAVTSVPPIPPQVPTQYTPNPSPFNKTVIGSAFAATSVPPIPPQVPTQNTPKLSFGLTRS